MIEKVTIQNLETSKKIQIDMEDSFWVLKYAYFGPIEATHSAYKYPAQIGKSKTESTLGVRTVEIVGYIIGSTESVIKKRKEELSSFLNPLQDFAALIGEYTLSFNLDSTVEFSKNYTEDNEVLCKFGIYGTAFDPLWKSTIENMAVAAGITKKFRFPLVVSTDNENEEDNLPLVFGVLQTSLIVAVCNTGAVETGMRIVFRANGTVVNPSLTNITTQKMFKLNKTMTAGEEITVDTNIGSKSIKGKSKDGVESNYSRYKDLKSKWLQLSRGDNLLRYDADSNGDLLEVRIYYDVKFIDVAG